jgi:hypothetical protein
MRKLLCIFTFSAFFAVKSMAPPWGGMPLNQPPGGSSPPPSYSYLVTGQTVGTARNNFNGDIGCVFTAAANSTAYGLGRWVISGNSQSHVLDLLDETTCTSLGSVTVNTSGAPAGQYIYATFSSPVSIVSGDVYAIVSEESGGGDQFYDDDTTVTFSALVNTGAQHSPFYALGALPGSVNTCTPVSGNGEMYGPVNMEYTTP